MRNLLHNEPHVRGLGYNQYADEVDEEDEEFRVVPNRSGLQPGMDDPGAMKQLLEDEDIEHYLRTQADV